LRSSRLSISLFWVLVAQVVWAQGIPGLNSSRAQRDVPSDRRWAVVIGVSEYEHLPKKSWLSSCDKDAEAIAEFLASPRGGEIPPDHMKVLLNEEATARNIRVALDFVITESAPGDVIYFFYAGHGKVRRYGSGDAAYLMAYDSEPDVLNATAIPMDEIHRYVDVHLNRASQVIMITDACHAGAILPTSPVKTQDSTRSLSEYLQNIGERDGVLNLMACRRDEVAFEDARLAGHGVLTYSLLRALSGEGNSTRDGKVRIQDVLEYVSFHVPRLTNQRQHPRHSTNYTDEFPLADLNKKGPELALPEPPADKLQASTSVYHGGKRATLKVVGAQRLAELYLVRDGEQRTIGRALSPTNILVTENLAPGDYTLVHLAGGVEKTWDVSLEKGAVTFDVRTGQIVQ
jgi:uncharacterized caspase-like protein